MPSPRGAKKRKDAEGEVAGEFGKRAEFAGEPGGRVEVAGELGVPSDLGKHAYDRLDRVLHEKARLGILTSLMTRPEGLNFNELKQLCALTDGNLSRHIEVLHEAGLIDVLKGYENNRPKTICKLTAAGRKRFLEYLAELERVIHDALPEGVTQTEPTKKGSPNATLGFGPA